MEMSEPMAARWRAMIQAEHAQSEAVRGTTPTDHWRPFAERFRPDLATADDPQLDAIARRVAPHHTLLDVGAGGGRMAVPLARRGRHVTAVEPSESMGRVLMEAAVQAATSNITLVRSTWEEASVPPADVVLCAHVLYTIQEIVPFVQKLEAHARERVIVVLFAEPALAHAGPFWRRVHGDERLRLPGLPEFVRLLWEMGTYPDVEMLPPRRSGRFHSLEEARQTLRARLYVEPGSPEDERLSTALDELLEEDDGALWVRGASPQRAGIITWTPGEGVP